MRRKKLLGIISTTLVLTACCGLGATASAHTARHIRTHHHRIASWQHHSTRVLQCVAFAKAASDVKLRGNAANWWQNADGVYARGTAPDVGSVLNFRANKRMRLGHVAVVTRILDSRTILIDQSHWNANGISRDVTVVDVSPNNDWSAVRVAIGHDGAFGSIYPTYGFIYPRPDTSGRIITASSDAAMPLTGNPAPSDLRRQHSEVAEAPAATGLDLTPGLVAESGPNRSLR